MTAGKAILDAQPLLALIPLADCGAEHLDALIVRLNAPAFVALAWAMTDEPADRPETHDETAWKQERNTMFEVLVRRAGSPVEVTHVYEDAHAAYAARLAIVAQLRRMGWRGQRNAAGVWRLWRGPFRHDRIAIRVLKLESFGLN